MDWKSWLGLDDPGGPWYLAWSGIVGDLPQLAALAMVYRRLNCHARGCWRISLHRVDDTPYHVCRNHHPDLTGPAPTAQQIADHAKGPDDQ